MPKFAANLSLMFPELEPAQRFQAARSAGFTAVEYLRPYEFPLKDVRQWRKDAGVELILLNSPAGNAQAGERGLGALSGRQADFRGEPRNDARLRQRPRSQDGPSHGRRGCRRPSTRRVRRGFRREPAVRSTGCKETGRRAFARTAKSA